MYCTNQCFENKCTTDLVDALENKGVKVAAHGCGHGMYRPFILLEDGRHIIINEVKSNGRFK